MASKIVMLTKAATTRGSMFPTLRTPEGERVLRERDEARAQARTLALANRRMAEFLGIASHELRSPVTSSSLGVQLAARRLDTLLDRVSPQDAELTTQLVALQGLLDKAEVGLERLTRLVNDLLDVSHLRSGQLALHPAHCELTAIVRAVVEEQRQLAPTRRITMHLPTRQPVPLWADADRIGQVVTNYLTNALKYSAADQPVDVRVQVSGEWARVTVRDQGPGLPVAVQERIWERFQRVPGVSVVGGVERGVAQSLGLGLYICKAIIEQHQGQVGVLSAPGHGSTFWFALPAMRLDGDEQQRLAS
jgi:signal transduction histidine kinase